MKKTITPNSKTWFIRNEHEKAGMLRVIRKLNPTMDKQYAITISNDVEERSDKQNRLSFLWYKERGKANMFSGSEIHERRYCKLHYGIPILRREDREFNIFYKKALMGLSYEMKLELMEYLPVTSWMSMKQFSMYLHTIDTESASAGCPLSHPEDLYYDALMKRVA